ncbi:MAG TPA: dihydroorotase, partial [Gammaproteobacteria bacterium]|nr:dihydroorotase [Gammaproteobacteria bacterium]
MKTRIRNGLLVDPGAAKPYKADLFLDHGKIAAIGKPPAGFKAAQTIDAAGRWVMPGLVDCQARLRDPGQPEKANIASETAAAVSKG